MEPDGREQELQPREHVIGTATRLFAALGYDATPITTIADAIGLDVPTVTALVGDKQTLYRVVMDRIQTGQRAMYDSIIAGFTPDRAGLHQMTDRLLDYCVTHPELPALWMHRWQSDAADVPELEGVYLQPDHERIRTLLRRIAPAETNADMALQTIGWAIRGFCIGGVVNRQGEREGPENPILLEQLRQHLHHLTDLLFQLDR